MAKDRDGRFFTRNWEEIERDPDLDWAAKGLFARIERNVELAGRDATGWSGTMAELMEQLGMKKHTLRVATAALEGRKMLRVTRLNGSQSRYEILPSATSNSGDVQEGKFTQPVRNSDRFEIRTGSKLRPVPVRISDRSGAKLRPVDVSVDSYRDRVDRVDDDVVARLRNLGVGKNEAERALRMHGIERVEIAEAITLDMQARGEIKRSPSAVFRKAVAAGPDEWPLPPGILTHSQREAAAAKRAARSNGSAQDATRQQDAAEAWAASIGVDQVQALLDGVPASERRQRGLRNPLDPRVRIFLFERHHGGNGNGRAHG